VQHDSILKGGGRLYVLCRSPKKAREILSRVSGIHATAIAQMHSFSSLAEMESEVVSFSKGFLKKGNSFAIDARVVGSKGFSKKDLENTLGAAVMAAIPDLVVKLKGPEKTIFVEARKKDFFVYSEQLRGLGGLPLGVEGNVAMFFSGKKDDVVASFLLMHRGCSIFPVVKKQSAKTKALVKKLVPFNSYRQFAITEQKNLEALVSERNIQAVATADSKTDKKSLASYKAFDAKQSLVVLRPLLLYPKESRKRVEALFS